MTIFDSGVTSWIDYNPCPRKENKFQAYRPVPFWGASLPCRRNYTLRGWCGSLGGIRFTH